MIDLCQTLAIQEIDSYPDENNVMIMTQKVWEPLFFLINYPNLASRYLIPEGPGSIHHTHECLNKGSLRQKNTFQ